MLGALGKLLGGVAHHAHDYPGHALYNLDKLGKQVNPFDQGQSWGNPHGQPQIPLRPIPPQARPLVPIQVPGNNYFSVNGVNYAGRPQPGGSPYWSPVMSRALPLRQAPFPELQPIRRL